jgi:hypothetical protein
LKRGGNRADDLRGVDSSDLAAAWYFHVISSNNRALWEFKITPHINGNV